jgi:hypothetical protein
MLAEKNQKPCNQLGRGVGTGGPGPPSFQKCPSSGSKVPFTSAKNVVQIAFFAQRALIYDCICFLYFAVCPENCCYFRVKLCYTRRIFFIFGKNMISQEKCLVCPENFLRCPPPTTPRRQHLREKIFRCPFLFEKCPSKPALPPNF